MTTNPYTPALHKRCITWAEMLTNPKRSLNHKACLAKFVHAYPEISHQVGVLIQLKLNIETIAKQMPVRNPNITIYVQ